MFKCIFQESEQGRAIQQHYSNVNQALDGDRKFAEKPNAMKKVALDDIDDIQTNQISEGGFSWSNMLGKTSIIHYSIRLIILYLY